MSGLKRWSSADSLELYNIPGWGHGYFDVNDSGRLIVRPNRQPKVGIDLVDLVEDAQRNGLALPLLIRFSDILDDRLKCMRRAFRNAQDDLSYQGKYFGVYPLKVNQQRQVVEEIVGFGKGAGMGLEAGSKSELHAVLGMELGPDSLVVCNGYKDADYVHLAIMGRKLGKSVYLVVEKPAELELVLRIAREHGVRPLIGMRIKLVAAGAGWWEDSGGDASKFGLTAPELVEAVERLRREDALEGFKLLHFHLGSQVPNIRHMKEALREMARYYAELTKLGCGIEYVDVGGGMGVDYDGTRTTHPSSINYTEEEYARDVVSILEEVCRHEGLPHPHIVTESGRALTAHHAMLVLNVFATARMDNGTAPVPEEGEPPELVAQLERTLEGIGNRTLHEHWHEALDLRDQANKLFELGYFPLHHRARAEQVFWRIASRAGELMRREKHPPDDLEDLEILLADKYFCNFSVFQSLPDSWAVGQQFPVLPLQRLHERPTRRGILQDLTCDSDGRITRYIGAYECTRTLPLHPLIAGEPYYLGVFLTGAYQEILGDLHNLYGDTNAIHVALNEDGSWRYEQVIRGESVADVLRYVQFDKDVLIDRIERQVRAAVDSGRMTPGEGRALRKLYAEGMDGYTYLEGLAHPGG